MRATRTGSLLRQSADSSGRSRSRSTARTTTPFCRSTTGMMRMSSLRVFVYEYLSGGGAGDDLTADDRALLEQGRAMRDAIVRDLARVDGVLVTRAAVD